jgi:hypothetical protein
MKPKKKAKKKAKKKPRTVKKVTPPLTSPPWFEFWVTHPVIRFQRTFGNGGKNLWKPSSTDPGTFALEPRRDAQGRLTGFKVKVTSGELPPEWDGVTLSPRGTKEPTIEELLPKWDKNKEIKYGKVLQKLVDNLHGSARGLQRLEGTFPVYDEATSSFNIDRVRIVNLSKVVEGKDDYSLVVLTLVDSYGPSGMQNGGGSGPPD